MTRRKPLDRYRPDPEALSRRAELSGALLASFWRRGLALLVDFLIAAAAFAVAVPGSILLGSRLGLLHLEHDVNLHFDFFHNWYSALWLVVYFTLAAYWGGGRTPGKRLFGIRIESLVHDRLTFWHALERALGYGASVLEGGFGFFQYFLRSDRQTVHDRIAETVVLMHHPGAGEVEAAPEPETAAPPAQPPSNPTTLPSTQSMRNA